MKTAVSQICTLKTPFEQEIGDYAAGACRSVELWLGKLEGYLEAHSVADVRRLLEEHRMTAPVASYQGGLFASDPRARQAHWQLFARRLEVCREVGVQTLVVAGDFDAPVAASGMAEVQCQLIEAAGRAAETKLDVAFEFQGRAGFANNLQTAVALVDACDQPNLGICLDAFHFHVGPSMSEDLAGVTAGNLYHVQLCDISGRPREWASDADRILPGDGDLPLGPLVETLRRIGYDRYVSVEAMNPRFWEIPPRQFAEIAITALRKQLGLAAMG